MMPEASTTVVSGKTRYRIGVRDELYERIKATAKQQGKSMTQLATEAFEAYLNKDSNA
jgi:sulfite reductase (ferredoxin)